MSLHNASPSPSTPPPAQAPEIVELRPVVAVVLDLFGAPEIAVRAWRPTIYQWSLCGMGFPLTDAAERQWRMMRPDTLVLANA